MFCYEQLMPDIALHSGHFSWGVQEFITKDEYQLLVDQYNKIADGCIDDCKEELFLILKFPIRLMNRYDAAMTCDNSEHREWAMETSVNTISKIETILSSHHIELPDIHKLDFLMIEDGDIWGPHFDGEPLSIILNKQNLRTMFNY